MKTSLGAKTAAYPTPVFVVGTYDEKERPNVMTVAWGGICCSDPPCVSIALRKATYSYSNLMERKAFTISIPSADQVDVADYFGIASGREEDKFATVGLTPARSELVDAPYIEEFPLILECKVVRVEELGRHTLFVGEILDVKIDQACLDDEGKPDVERLRPFGWAPIENQYYAMGKKLGRGFSVGRVFEQKDA